MLEGQRTLDNSATTNPTGWARKYGQMVHFMRVSSRMARSMARAFTSGVSRVCMRVNGATT